MARINGRSTSASGATGDPVSSSAVTNRSEVLPFFDACRTRRGTILLMADSNHNFNSWGWCLGLGVPLLRRYGCWGLAAAFGGFDTAATMAGGTTSGNTSTGYATGGIGMSVVASSDLITVASDQATGREWKVKWVSTSCGLSVDSVYFWNRQSSTTGYFYDTLANAIAGGGTGRIDITNDAYIGARLTWMGDTVECDICNGPYFPSFTPSATDQANNVLTFPGVHGFTAADEVHVSATGGGLTAGTSYYVKLGDESDANTTFECRLYTDAGLTSIVDITADITAKISRILVANASTRPGYIASESTAPKIFLGNRDSLKATWFHRKFVGDVPGSFTPGMRFATNIGATGTAQTTVASGGSEEWASATLTVPNSFATGSLASATQMTLTAHVLNTTDPVVLRLGGTNGTQVFQGITYFVRRVDANTIQLHASAANASANTSALTLTGISGTLDRRWQYSEWWSSQFNSVKLKGKCRFSGRYVEDPDCTNGLALSTYFGVGGATAQSMLSTLNADAVVLPRHLTELRSITSNGPLMIWIQVGGNDRSGSVPSATVQANVQAIMDLWTAGWAAAGGAASDLYFVLMLNHPQQSIAENLNDAYHAAYDTLCANNSRTANVKIKTLAPAGEMYLQGATVWFDSGGDAHLTAAGYTELGARIVSHLCG